MAKHRSLTPKERFELERLPLNVLIEREFRDARQRGAHREVLGHAMWCMKNAIAALEYAQSEPGGDWSAARANVVREVLYGPKTSAVALANVVRTIQRRRSRSAPPRRIVHFEEGKEFDFADFFSGVRQPPESLRVQQAVSITDAAFNAGIDAPLAIAKLIVTVAGLPPLSERAQALFSRGRDSEMTVRLYLRLSGYHANKIRSLFSRLEKRERRKSVR